MILAAFQININKVDDIRYIFELIIPNTIPSAQSKGGGKRTAEQKIKLLALEINIFGCNYKLLIILFIHYFSK